MGLLVFGGGSTAAAGGWELELAAASGDAESGTVAKAGDVTTTSGNPLSFDFTRRTDFVPDSTLGLTARRFLSSRFALAGEVSFGQYDLVTEFGSLSRLTDATTGAVLQELSGGLVTSSKVDAYAAAVRGEVHFAPGRRFDPYVGVSVGTLDFRESEGDIPGEALDGGLTLGALAGVNVPVGSRGTYLGLGVHWDSLTAEQQWADLSTEDHAPYRLEGDYVGDDSAEAVRLSFLLGWRFGER